MTDFMVLIEKHKLCLFWDEPMRRWQVNAHNDDDLCATDVDLQNAILECVEKIEDRNK